MYLAVKMLQEKKSQPGIRWLPLIMLIVLGAFWGANPSYSKALAASQLSPAAVVFWQTFLAGAVLSLVCLVRGKPVPVTRRAIIYYLVIGLVGIDISYMTMVFVTKYVTAGYASVVILLSPVLTYVFATLFRLEKINPVRALGIAIGFMGAGLLVFPKGSLPTPDLLPIALMAFIIPTGFAVANIYSEWGRPKGADNEALAAGTMFAAAVGALIVAGIDGTFHPIWDAPAQRDLILLAHACSTALAFMLFYRIVTMAGAVYLSQVGYLGTLFGVAWGIVLFGETTTIWFWVAILVVGVGVGMVNLGKRKKI